jgi:hypothetical protein
MKKLNLIRKIINFPFLVCWRIASFIIFPLTAVLGFLQTNWEDDWDRNYFIKTIKKDISFGFWKEIKK